MRTRNLTIVLTDVKGYTERQSRSSRREIEASLRRHREVVAPALEAFGGRIVKTMGDAFLAAFESPTDAVHAAVQVQKALAAQNAALADPAQATHVRVAISTGEVSEDDDGDVYGEPVNLAARLEGIAEAGTIYLTETTFLSMNRNEIPALEVGHRVFKGIPEEVKVYRILDDFVANARLLSPDEIRRIAHESSAPARGRGGRTGLLVGVGALLLLAGGGAAWILLRPPSSPSAPPATAPATGTLVDEALRQLGPSVPKPLLARLGAAVRSGVEALAKGGDYAAARELAQKALERAPQHDGARDLLLDVNRWELEAAVDAGTVGALVRQNPPAWYDANVQGLHARFHGAPRYEWLRAVWSLASEPTRASTADVAEAAVAANPDALGDDTLTALLVRAVEAADADETLAKRYRALLARVAAGPAAGGPDRSPAPTGRRPRGPAMRDR